MVLIGALVAFVNFLAIHRLVRSCWGTIMYFSYVHIIISISIMFGFFKINLNTLHKLFEDGGLHNHYQSAVKT